MSPASSSANVGLIRRAPGAETLTGSDHGPVGGRSATATWERLPVSVKSHIAVRRPSRVAAISALQFELPGPLERGSDAAKAGASAAFDAVSTWKSPSSLVRRVQIAATLPAASIATRGVPHRPVPASGDAGSAGRNVWSAERRMAASTRTTASRVRRPHATTARPLSATATDGPRTIPVTDNCGVVSRQSPPAGFVRAWTPKVGAWSQASVTLPAGSTTIAGLDGVGARRGEVDGPAEPAARRARDDRHAQVRAVEALEGDVARPVPGDGERRRSDGLPGGVRRRELGRRQPRRGGGGRTRGERDQRDGQGAEEHGRRASSRGSAPTIGNSP